MPTKPKKKRGRRPKKRVVEKKPIVKKKRGRKPKGGKIINKLPEPVLEVVNDEPNIILHLKCNSKDLMEQQHKNFFTTTEYDPRVSQIESFETINPLSRKMNTCEIIGDYQENKIMWKKGHNILSLSRLLCNKTI